MTFTANVSDIIAHPHWCSPQDQAQGLKRFAQVQYYCKSRIIFLHCTCADPCNTTLQYKFSTTCRKLAGYLQQL